MLSPLYLLNASRDELSSVCVWCLLPQGAPIYMRAHTWMHTDARTHVLKETVTSPHNLRTPLKKMQTNRRREKKMLLWDREDASHCTINNPVKLCVAKAGSAAALSSFLTPLLPPSSLTPSLPSLSSFFHYFLFYLSHFQSLRGKWGSSLNVLMLWCWMCDLLHSHFLYPCRAHELESWVSVLRRKRQQSVSMNPHQQLFFSRLTKMEDSIVM